MNNKMKIVVIGGTAQQECHFTFAAKVRSFSQRQVR